MPVVRVEGRSYSVGDMGIYDRDYIRNPSGRPAFNGSLNAWSVNTWLIAINVAVFILNALISAPIENAYGQIVGRFQPIEALGYFSVTEALGHLQVWRLVTFQFLHANVEHILFNMVALYMFGPLIESYLGSRRYLAFYLLCGAAGPVMYIVLWVAHILISHPAVPLVGASAGIFGVLVAAAMVAPNTEVLVWGVLPVRLPMLAWGLLAIAAYTVFQYGSVGQNNAGGQAAHLGGAAAGYLLIRNKHVLNVFGPRRPRMRYRS